MLGFVSGFYFLGELDKGPLIIFTILLIVASLLEEYVFRGMLLSFGRTMMPFHLANGIQALVFAIVHFRLDIRFFIGYLVFGYLVGHLMRNKEKASLVYPMVAHLLANLLQFMLVMIS